MKQNRSSAPKGTSLIRIPEASLRYVTNQVLNVASPWFLFYCPLISAGVISNYWTRILIKVAQTSFWPSR